MNVLNFVTRYRSRYHRPRGFLSFLGDVFVFGDEFVRLFDFATSTSGVIGSAVDVVDVTVAVATAAWARLTVLIQCFCGKSFSDIFCTQTSGCRFRSIDASFAIVGDRKYLDRVDIFLSVRSRMLVVGATAKNN